MSNQETKKLVMEERDEAAMKWAMSLVNQIPKTSKEDKEAHITAVLIVFWGALWGTFGTEFARGFIEAQLRGMDGPHQKFTQNTH
jgi:hypothetical protein